MLGFNHCAGRPFLHLQNIQSASAGDQFWILVGQLRGLPGEQPIVESFAPCSRVSLGFELRLLKCGAGFLGRALGISNGSAQRSAALASASMKFSVVRCFSACGRSPTSALPSPIKKLANTIAASHRPRCIHFSVNRRVLLAVVFVFGSGSGSG